MEQTPEKQDNTANVVDNVDRDWLLQHLVTAANHEKDFTQPITLWVGGGVISGLLVSGKKFFDVYSDEFSQRFSSDDSEGMRDLIRDLGKTYYEPVENPMADDTIFVHLLDAKFWTPSGSLPSIGNPGVAWRGRISQVTGYSLGQIVPKE